jgi:hypothetical protein
MSPEEEREGREGKEIGVWRESGLDNAAVLRWTSFGYRWQYRSPLTVKGAEGCLGFSQH